MKSAERVRLWLSSSQCDRTRQKVKNERVSGVEDVQIENEGGHKSDLKGQCLLLPPHGAGPDIKYLNINYLFNLTDQTKTKKLITLYKTISLAR